MIEFLHMGGYGSYVWSSYGVTFLALVILLWVSWRSARRAEAKLAQLRLEDRPARRGIRPKVVDMPAPTGGPASHSDDNR